MQILGSSAEGQAPLGRLVVVLDRWLGPVETVFNLIAALGIFALMLLGVSQVLGRKLLNIPIFGYIDIIEILMPTFAFMGVAYCQRLGGHVRMELALAFLNKRSVWLFEVIGTVLGLVIIAVLIYYSYEHFLRAYNFGDSTMDANLPTWPSKLLVPLSLALLWLRLLVQLIGYGRLLVAPYAEPIAVPLIATVEEQALEEVRSTVAEENESAKGSSGDTP